MFFSLSLFFLIGALFLARRLQSPWRSVVICVVLILTFRVLAFENPVSWKIFSMVLGPADIGWRQSGTMGTELWRFYKKPAHTRFLAVGSSQVQAVFSQYSQSHNGLSYYHLPGMAPLDFVLHRDRILRFNPKTIILYLSEFDLTRRITLSSAKQNPSPGRYWPEFYQKMSSSFLWPEVRPTFQEMIVGDLFPEYKFAFVFRGLTNKLFQRKTLLNEFNVTKVMENEMLKRQLVSLEKNLNNDERLIKLHIGFLEDFLDFCQEHGIFVYVLEGEYHPKAYSPKNIQLNKIARTHIQDLLEKWPDTQFLPRESFFHFTEDDYRDGYHVKFESGWKYTDALMTHLDTHPHDDGKAESLLSRQ